MLKIKKEQAKEIHKVSSSLPYVLASMALVASYVTYLTMSM